MADQNMFTVPGLEQPVPVTRDIEAWTYLCIEPSEIPHKYEYADGPNPHIILTIGPDSGSYIRYTIRFTLNGTWIDATDSTQASQTHILAARHGYTAAQAAHHLAVQAELGNSYNSWSRWRTSTLRLSTSEVTDDVHNRLRELKRRHTTHQVRLDALEALAADHATEFDSHPEAQQVIRALSSDWHPDTK